MGSELAPVLSGPERTKARRPERRARPATSSPFPDRRVIQRSLVVGATDDPLECEADEVAAAIVASLAGPASRPPTSAAEGRIRRSGLSPGLAIGPAVGLADGEQAGRIRRRAGAPLRAPIGLDVRPESGDRGRQYRIAARDDAKTLGSATVHDGSGPSAEVTDLEVAPGHRGHGHGADLLGSAALQAEQLGKSKVALAAQDDGSGRLDSWYRGLGFAEVGVNDLGYREFEAPTSRLVGRRVQRRSAVGMSRLIQRMNTTRSKTKGKKNAPESNTPANRSNARGPGKGNAKATNSRPQANNPQARTGNTHGDTVPEKKSSAVGVGTERTDAASTTLPVQPDEKESGLAETASTDGGPAVVNGPSAIEILTSRQASGEQPPVDGESIKKTKSPVRDEVAEAYPEKVPITAHAATTRVEGGTAVDRVVHDIALKLTEIFDQEVPLFSEGIPEKFTEKKEPPSKNEMKKQAALAIAAQSKKGPAKKVVGTQARKEAEDVPRTEKTFFQERRKQLKAPKLGPRTTSILRALRTINRLYLLALRGASNHPWGTNVFTYLGVDYVVNAERYVRPYDASFDKHRSSNGYVEVPRDAFDDFDYPANILSLEDFRRIAVAILQDRIPPVSTKQMTVFLAAVACETARYAPQLASVMFALTGVTDSATTNQESIFTEGLTMTTGSTDPTGGKHKDTRPGFAEQPEATAATDAAAIREGALLVSAFSKTGLDVLRYIKAQLDAGVAANTLVTELSDRLIGLMNSRAEGGGRRGGDDGHYATVDLTKMITPEMLTKHFPESANFSDRSVKDDTIVLLDQRERAQLAYDIARSIRPYRSAVPLRIVMKTGGKYQVGRAHIKLSGKGAKSGSSKLNHWEGVDGWMGGEPPAVSAAGLEQAIEQCRSPWAEHGQEGPSEDPAERIAEVMGRIERLDKETRAAVVGPLHEVLEGHAHSDREVRDQALALLGEIEQLVKAKSLSKEKLLKLLDDWGPSDEWNLAPTKWIKAEASGEDHNCLIDSLLQLTTNLTVAERLEEAKLIRYELIREGLTRPMEFLYGSKHAPRILELIGVNPDNYEVRTEWTHGGELKESEIVGTDNPTVLRLWNTGGHYEPITIRNFADTDDLAPHQSNDQLLRHAKPPWMHAASLELDAGGDISNMEEKVVAETALKWAGTTIDEKTTGEPKKPMRAFTVQDVEGFEIAETLDGEVRVLTITDTRPSKDTAVLKDPTSGPAFTKIVKAYKVTPAALTEGKARLLLVSGDARYKFEDKKWKKQ